MTDNTHVTTTNKPVSKIESLSIVMAGEPMKQVMNYYNGSKDEAMRFMTAAIQYVRRVPKLLECDRTSLIMAFVQSAQFKFMPSGSSGEAYVIPYGIEAKFQIGYQGIVTLLYRTGKISAITSNIIYKNDVFEYQEGLDAVLIHKPAMFGKEKGEAIGVYTVAQMSDGTKTFKVMDKDAIMAIKNLSKAKGTKDSPWNSDKDPEKWMWRKTCLIQHSKLLPKTEDIIKAIDIDNDGEGIDKPLLDPAGPATAKALHGSDSIASSESKPDEEDINPDAPYIPTEEEQAEIIKQEKDNGI